MFNIKNIKTQKKLIFLSVFIIAMAAIAYSGWFLYNNFYYTINWHNHTPTSLNQTAAIKHVDLNDMREVAEKIKADQTATSSNYFDINIDFR